MFFTNCHFILEREELNLENEGGILWNDWWVTTSTISILWGKCEDGFLADLHCGNTFAPAGDDALSDGELEWGIPGTGAIELRTIGKGTDIVNIDFLSTLWLGASTFNEDLLGDLSVSSDLDLIRHYEMN